MGSTLCDRMNTNILQQFTYSFCSSISASQGKKYELEYFTFPSTSFGDCFNSYYLKGEQKRENTKDELQKAIFRFYTYSHEMPLKYL